MKSGNVHSETINRIRRMPLERKATLVLAVVIATLGLDVAAHFLVNAAKTRRNELNARLDEIAPIAVEFPVPNWDFEKWEKAIAAKPSLWKELVEPPPVVEKPQVVEKPKPPPFPDGIVPTRAKVGDKVKIVTPQDPKGKFMAVGDVIDRWKIKEISKTAVIFATPWEGGEITKEIDRK